MADKIIRIDMKYIDAEKLKAEIKRRIEWLRPATTDFAEGRQAEMRSLYDFIDSLQQEQLPGIEEHGIPGKDFIPVEWVDACEKYGKWKIVQREQPSDDLEEAARNVYESWMGGTMDDFLRDMVELGKALNARKEDEK